MTVEKNQGWAATLIGTAISAAFIIVGFTPVMLPKLLDGASVLGQVAPETQPYKSAQLPLRGPMIASDYGVVDETSSDRVSRDEIAQSTRPATGSLVWYEELGAWYDESRQLYYRDGWWRSPSGLYWRNGTWSATHVDPPRQQYTPRVHTTHNVEQWAPLVVEIFGSERAPYVLSVMDCESDGNPNATGAAGEMGLMQIHPRWHRDATYDPRGNLLAAYRISSGGYDWSAWTCKP